MNYIGMDCHIKTLDFAVVDEAGRLVKAKSIPTSVNGFIEFVRTVPPPRTVYMEEGTLAAWAQLARGGYMKEIHHSLGQRRRFRELMMAYHDTVRSTVRIKNKIKAKFRQNGIQCTGATVYSETYRLEWRDKLPR